MASRFEQAVAKHDAEALRKTIDKMKNADMDIEFAVLGAVHEGDAPTLEFLLDTLHPPLPTHLMHVASKIEIVRILLAHGMSVNALHDNRSDKPTPLHTSADYNRLDLAPALVELGADVNARDLYGRTPLIIAATDMATRGAAKGMEMIALLAELGADPTLTDYHGNGMATYYRFACASERVKPDKDVLKRMAEMGSPDDKATFDLFIAIDQDVTAVRKAIAEGADVNHISPAPGMTPLESASFHGNTEIIQALLDAGADPNKPGDGGTPLIRAARMGHLPVVKQLIAAGADIEMIEPDSGYEDEDEQCARRVNAYLAAEIAREHDVVDYLKSLGSGKPKPVQWKPIEPGVGSWNDFSEVLVKADAARTADALAKMIGGKVELNAYGRSFTPGERAYVVVRPKGMDWTNVFQVAPPRLRFEDADKKAQFAADLAQAARTSVLTVDYSDTAGAGEVGRYEPTGGGIIDDGWDDEMLEEVAGALGDGVPDSIRQRLAEVDPDKPRPTSEKRIETLARDEKFAVASFDAYCEPGRNCDVEFTGYPAEAFDGVAFVSS